MDVIFKVIEDLSYVVLLRKKFSYIESIPGVLLPHPSSVAYHPLKVDGYGLAEGWHFHHGSLTAPPPPPEFYQDHHFSHPNTKITPSMSSLEALLSKLPSVVPAAGSSSPPMPAYADHPQAPLHYLSSSHNNNDDDDKPMGLMDMEKIGKDEFDGDEEEEDKQQEKDVGESSSSMSSYHHQEQHFAYHQDLNVSEGMHHNSGY